MKILLKHASAFCMFLIIIFCAFSRIYAAQAQFDINLKELRKSRAPYDINLGELRRNSQKRTESKQKQRSYAFSNQETSAAPDSTDETSAYAIQQGDTISLILTRYYGLSQTAAEHLIPRVIRINNLRNVRRLTIGQTLLFPLPSPENMQRKQTVEQKKITDVDATKAAPISSPQDTDSWQEIQIREASPCALARELSEKLKWHSASLDIFTRENISIHLNERKLIVICGAKPSEADSIERLLAHGNMQLLFFEENESPLRVTKTIFEKAGVSVKKSNGETEKNSLTFFYLAPDANNPGYTVRLTVLPEDANAEKAGASEKVSEISEVKPDHEPEKAFNPSETSGEVLEKSLALE